MPIVSGVQAVPHTTGADFHVGVFRFVDSPTGGAPEDWYWWGVYVEKAPVTIDVAGPVLGSGYRTDRLIETLRY